MIVYALLDPRTREIRYVGETVRDPRKRLSQHMLAAAKQTTPPVNAWMRGLANVGERPEILEIESCVDVQQMHSAEEFWIEQFRAIGASLLNVAPGGSTRKGYRHSEETKAKWRRERRGENAPMFGKRRTPEQIERFREIGEALWVDRPHPNLGKKHSPETIEKIRATRKGRPVSQACLDALARGRETRWGKKE